MLARHLSPPGGAATQAGHLGRGAGLVDEDRSVAIFRETRNGVRPISGANNGATAIAFGGPRSSCVRPGAHSARHQDSRNDLTPCRMAWHFVSTGAHAPHSDQTLGPTPTRGASHFARRLPPLASLCSSEDQATPTHQIVLRGPPRARSKARFGSLSRFTSSSLSSRIASTANRILHNFTDSGPDLTRKHSSSSVGY